MKCSRCQNEIKKIILDYGANYLPVLCEIEKNSLGNGESRNYFIDLKNKKICLASKTQIKNNIYEGYYKEYYENGNISLQGKQYSGYLFGTVFCFNYDGTLKTSTYYRCGKSNGYSFEYKNNKIVGYSLCIDDFCSPYTKIDKEEELAFIYKNDTKKHIKFPKKYLGESK